MDNWHDVCNLGKSISLQVIQKCDVVMASGHNVTTFAIPALQPLVLALFVRSTKVSSDIDIQRFAVK